MSGTKSNMVEPPKAMDFEDPAAWTRWIQRFRQYIKICNVTDDEERRDLMLYCIGERSGEVMTQIGKKETFEEIVQGFENYFEPRRNIIFERAKFHNRKQLAGETFTTYITEIYNLAKNCEFEKITKEEIMRDKIVVGINNSKLSEKLQLTQNLTLQMAIDIIKQHESQTKQTEELYEEREVGRIKKEFKEQNRKCGACGFQHYNKITCPAKDSNCHRCGKRGHYARVCRNLKTVQVIEQKENHFEEGVGSI
ncbi:uncharacterized protein LOC114364817 [Ostrinia furnacalis]|uniref:uncharacterized protein LOC114364817 n=1 Tax=Ostrinia furnacalis TaxID=93504 RepID=UPI00103D55A2|nr:uncharacterized protein LOC114364817 [Ostrinia furnacalis]